MKNKKNLFISIIIILMFFLVLFNLSEKKEHFGEFKYGNHMYYFCNQLEVREKPLLCGLKPFGFRRVNDRLSILFSDRLINPSFITIDNSKSVYLRDNNLIDDMDFTISYIELFNDCFLRLGDLKYTIKDFCDEKTSFQADIMSKVAYIDLIHETTIRDYGFMGRSFGYWLHSTVTVFMYNDCYYCTIMRDNTVYKCSDRIIMNMY